MEKTDILYLNAGHQEVVEVLMEDVKKIMYYATEYEIAGKYQDFLNILDSVYLYSNNFHETTLKIDGDDMIVHLEKIANLCENSTGELADVLIDATDEKRLSDRILEKETTNN